MLIIIEGANKVGKTTLAQGLMLMLKDNGYKSKYIRVRPKTITSPVLPAPFPDSDAFIAAKNFIDGMSAVLENFIDDEAIFIVDRFDVTECVYSRDRNYDIDDEMFGLHQYLVNKGAKYIFVESNFNHIEDEAQKAKLELIQQSFWGFFEVTEDGASSMLRVSTDIAVNDPSAYVKNVLEVYKWVTLC